MPWPTHGGPGFGYGPCLHGTHTGHGASSLFATLSETAPFFFLALINNPFISQGQRMNNYIQVSNLWQFSLETDQFQVSYFNLPTYFIVQLSKMRWNVGTAFTRPERGAFQGSMTPKLSSVWETGRKMSHAQWLCCLFLFSICFIYLLICLFIYLF